MYRRSLQWEYNWHLSVSWIRSDKPLGLWSSSSRQCFSLLLSSPWSSELQVWVFYINGNFEKGVCTWKQYVKFGEIIIIIKLNCIIKLAGWLFLAISFLLYFLLWFHMCMFFCLSPNDFFISLILPKITLCIRNRWDRLNNIWFFTCPLVPGIGEWGERIGDSLLADNDNWI